MSVSHTASMTMAPPTPADGPVLWSIADGTGVLDVNSRYAYALWSRDFAATSVVARLDGSPVGFVTGYRRPTEPDTLFVWQVAVDAAARGHGVAAAMLDELADRVGCTRLETTITADNTASIALFSAFAQRRGAAVERGELFADAELGVGTKPEFLYRIGPFTTTTTGEMHAG